MNGSVLHSALRELKGIAASRNLWLTFGAVVLLFVVTGPFGTLEHLRFLPRLGYWLVLHGLAWSVALIGAVLGDVLLGGLIDRTLWRMMTGSVLAAIPIGAITHAMQYAWFGPRSDAAGLASEMLFAAPLCVIFCLITYMAMSATPLPGKDEMVAAGTAAPDNAPSPPAAVNDAAPLLRRLKPENRGALRHLAVEDHYTLVSTSRGRELILLRFSDALAETGATAGLQVHRSHWVADDFVASVNRANGRISLRLADGTDIPVSRTYAAEVRARFG